MIWSKIKNFFGRTTSSFMSAWLTPSTMSPTDMLQEYKRYVYVCVTSIAEEFAKIDVQILQGDKEVLNHEFIKLLRRPNPMQSQYQFLQLHQTYMELNGESFWFVERGQRSLRPTGLYLIRPDLMTVVVGQDEYGLVVGYKMKKPDGKETPFELDEIIHFKRPNPMNPYRGLGPVEAGSAFIQTEQYSSEFTRNSIFNAGRPSGIIVLKGVTDKKGFDDFKRRFNSEYSGTQNAGKTMFFRGADGLEYQKLGIDLGDVAMRELKEMSRDDIMTMYRVSKTILGISEGVTLNNAREARRAFIEQVVRNKMEEFVDHLTATFPNLYGNPNQIVWYRDPSRDTVDEKIQRWKEGHLKWITTNQILEEQGLPGIGPEGDKLYVPMNLVAVGEDKEVQPPEDPNKEEKRIKKSIKGTLKDASLPRYVRGEIFRKQLYMGQEQWEKKYKKAVQGIFKDQLKQILERNKAYNKTFESWFFDLTKSKQVYISTLSPIALEMLREQSRLAFELSDVEGQNELIITEELRQMIRDRIEKFAVEVDDQTTDKIRDQIAEGMGLGESVSKLRGRIKDVYENADTVRAERIARSETIYISNEAAIESYRQIPVVQGQEWMAEPDSCEFCQALNGKIIGLSDSYAQMGSVIEGKEGGQYILDYGTLGHPPLHPNCRCAVLPVTEGSLLGKKLDNVIDKKLKNIRLNIK